MKHIAKHPTHFASIIGTATLALSASSSAATVLTGLTNTNTAVPVDHGSFEVGTPNIALSWSTIDGGVVDSQDWQQYNNWPNDPGNGVYQIDNATEGNQYLITFTPDAGFNVLLSSADINVWSGGGAFNIDWSVDGSTSGNLGSGSMTANDGSVTAISFGDLTGTSGENVTMTLTIAAGSGTGSYLAMDNLSFDQVAIPEPSTSLMAAAGLGAMAMRRRRK